jgi:hypothetical protein
LINDHQLQAVQTRLVPRIDHKAASCASKWSTVAAAFSSIARFFRYAVTPVPTRVIAKLKIDVRRRAGVGSRRRSYGARVLSSGGRVPSNGAFQKFEPLFSQIRSVLISAIVAVRAPWPTHFHPR